MFNPFSRRVPTSKVPAVAVPHFVLRLNEAYHRRPVKYSSGQSFCYFITLGGRCLHLRGSNEVVSVLRDFLFSLTKPSFHRPPSALYLSVIPFPSLPVPLLTLRPLLLPLFSRVLAVMVAITSVLWLTALLLLNCFQQVESARRFDRRRDLQDVPPVNASAASWIVPLQGSKTCDPGRNCECRHFNFTSDREDIDLDQASIH